MAFKMAIGDKNTQETIYAPTKRFYDKTINEGIYSLLPNLYEHCDSEKLENIIVRKLDDVVKDLNIEKIDLIKIDVEGYEYKVLMGMKEILEKNKPNILIELNYKKHIMDYEIPEILEFFRGYGYECRPTSKLNSVILDEDVCLYRDWFCYQKTTIFNC
jgi:FkbM family methyltransferase